MNMGTINRIYSDDVADFFVKCMLYDISEKLGNFTKDELYRTIRYFDFNCPYTGKDIGADFYNGDYVIDFLIPMNKDSCGLHLYGNIIVTTRETLTKKRENFFEDYIYHDTDGTEEERIQRIEKIRSYQSSYIQNFNKIRNNIELKELCKRNYNSILNQLNELKNDYTKMI